MKRAVAFFILCFVLSLQAQSGTLTQYSTIDALIKGIYDGDMSLEALKNKGDFGIGTYNRLDGEMVFLGGRFYRIEGSGNVKEVPSGMIPFAAVTYFKADKTIELEPGTSMLRLQAVIDSLIPTKNIFYAVRICGDFQQVKTRSVPAQTKPYKPLTEVVKSQPVFSFADVKGTILGFRCPAFAAGVNVPGYHLHFLKSDTKGGGHVLDFTTGKVKIEIDEIGNFSLLLPEGGDFYSADLSHSSEKDVRKVEK